MAGPACALRLVFLIVLVLVIVIDRPVPEETEPREKDCGVWLVPGGQGGACPSKGGDGFAGWVGWCPRQGGGTGSVPSAGEAVSVFGPGGRLGRWA